MRKITDKNKDQVPGSKKDEKTFDNPVELFERLVEESKEKIFIHLFFSFGITGIDERKDIMQKIFMKAYKKFYKYDPSKKFLTWILSFFAQNEVRKHWKEEAETIAFSQMQRKNSDREDLVPFEDTKEAADGQLYTGGTGQKWTLDMLLKLLAEKMGIEMLESGEPHKALAHFSRHRLDRFDVGNGVEKIKEEFEALHLGEVSGEVKAEYLSSSCIEPGSRHYNDIRTIFNTFDHRLDKKVKDHIDPRNPHKNNFNQSLLNTPARATTMKNYYRNQPPKIAISGWIKEIKCKTREKWKVKIHNLLSGPPGPGKPVSKNENKNKRNVKKNNNNKGDVK